MFTASVADGLRAGYAAVDITPPPEVDLTGFIARDGPCLGTLDPLEARALVFEDARGQRAALVTCDLIGLGRNLVARVRRRVADAAGIPVEAQLFNCSHTHSGPETGVLTTIGAPDPAYLAGLEERLASVIVEAGRSPAPVRLRLAATEVGDGLVVNRVFRRVGRPDAVDRQLTVVRVEQRDGPHHLGEGRGEGDARQPLATIVAFACHAVSLGAAERHASADFVAPLRRDLEAAGAGPVLYVNGCGGDVNPASMDARGREARDALGHRLARYALAAVKEPTPLAPLPTGEGGTPADGGTMQAPVSGEGSGAEQVVAAAQEWVDLPFQAVRSAEDAAALLTAGRERLARAAHGSPSYRATLVTEIGYPLRLLRLHYGSEQLPQVRAEVQAIRIGPLAVVALPGEIFSSLGRTIKAASPFAAPQTLIAGWSNDNVGYVPDREAYPLGGYEVDLASRYYGYPAGWAPEAGDRLVAAAGRVLGQVAAAG
ncbi:MAG: hypothetical protein ACRDI2_16430 [Chloroflexota bacterium]